MEVVERQSHREFEFSIAQFEHLRRLVKVNTGINLSEGKYDMVYGRLARRLRVLELRNFAEYLDYVEHGHSDELPELINAITTNLTSFFRERHHFDFLKNSALPDIAARSRSKRLRIWSAGCSTGEEPYSIAITLQGSEVTNSPWDTKILATDLDSNCVAHGRHAVYRPDRFNGLDSGIVKRWFEPAPQDGREMYRAKSPLREMVTYKQLNLLNDWPMHGPFDVIFCRNVVIYFDKETQRQLFDRYANILAPGGYLFIGHSETLFKVSERFESLGNTVYRKKG